MYHLCLGIKIFQTLNYLIMDNLINSWESNVHMFFSFYFCSLLVVLLKTKICKTND